MLPTDWPTPPESGEETMVGETIRPALPSACPSALRAPGQAEGRWQPRRCAKAWPRQVQGGYVSLWGRGAVTRFDGREGDLTLDGEIASAMVGADWAREDWTPGLIVSRSDAEGGYEGHSGGRGRGDAHGPLSLGAACTLR